MSKDTLAAAPRARNLLFDAIAEVTGLDPKSAGGLIGKVSAALADCEPPYTPDEVRAFAVRFWEICPYAKRDERYRPTPNEVEKYIGLVRKPKVPPQESQAERDRREEEEIRRKTS